MLEISGYLTEFTWFLFCGSAQLIFVFREEYFFTHVRVWVNKIKSLSIYIDIFISLIGGIVWMSWTTGQKKNLCKITWDDKKFVELSILWWVPIASLVKWQRRLWNNTTSKQMVLAFFSNICSYVVHCNTKHLIHYVWWLIRARPRLISTLHMVNASNQQQTIFIKFIQNLTNKKSFYRENNIAVISFSPAPVARKFEWAHGYYHTNFSRYAWRTEKNRNSQQHKHK